MTTAKESYDENIAHTEKLSGTFPKGMRWRDAVRRKCIDCQGGQVTEVATCHLTYCALWPFRMGKDGLRDLRPKSNVPFPGRPA